MFLWTLIAGGLYGGAFCSTKRNVRRTCLQLLVAWLVFSVIMLLLGVDPNARD